MRKSNKEAFDDAWRQVKIAKNEAPPFYQQGYEQSMQTDMMQRMKSFIQESMLSELAAHLESLELDYTTEQLMDEFGLSPSDIDSNIVSLMEDVRNNLEQKVRFLK